MLQYGTIIERGLKKNLKKYFNVEVSSCKPGHD